MSKQPKVIEPDPVEAAVNSPRQGPDDSTRIVVLNGETYLSPEALCERWGHTVRLKTLKNWRNMEKGPGHTKFGRLVFYPLSKVEKYERTEMGLRPPRSDPPPLPPKT